MGPVGDKKEKNIEDLLFNISLCNYKKNEGIEK